MRAGLALAALAGALVVLSPGGALVEGRAAGAGERLRTIEPDATVATAIGIAAIAVLGLAAALPFLWAHLAGIAVATTFAYYCGATVFIARISDDFAPEAEITLEGAGVLLVTAFWLALAGVVISLVGLRRAALAGERADAAAAADGEPPPRSDAPARSSPRAIVALALGVGGIITVASSPLAIAVGTLALSDIRRSRGALGGRGLALAGIVLGVLVMSLFTAALGVGTLAASPA